MVAAAHTWPAGLGSLVRVHSQGGSCKHDLSLDSQISVGVVSTLLLDRVGNIEGTSDATKREAPATCDSADLEGKALSRDIADVQCCRAWDLTYLGGALGVYMVGTYLRCLTRAAVALLV